MFQFAKKKNSLIKIGAPISGELKELSSASDPVFKEKLMGDGFYIIPNSNKVYAPISGTVEAIFPTKHAFTLRDKNNISVLIHIGTDTVQLDGVPFKLEISEGEHVNVGDLLATVNFEYIYSKGKGTEVYVVFPEIDAKRKLKINLYGAVSYKEIVATI
ncbi:PTS sugar transporter subunit IIA [Listeria immobilis]|uniref:PTS sugar transporter subunit IIA n=1 Tax=Listeria immobilis TaxID=2713502 RepID=UPI0016249AD5|nr:PTS glucose transporter subunit IIA [Listeria immobilis]MBC1514684.1 PTS glucose transporter subunit IIA [Listeria immobilis]